MRDPKSGLHLPTAGEQLLDGTQALAWVRSRHPQLLVGGRWTDDRSADPTRTTHAAEVLGQVRDRVDDPLVAQQVAWRVGPRLRRDDDLGPLGLARLARALRAAEPDVVTVPARVSGTEVPFAFVTAETREALAPLRSKSCEQAR